MHEVSFSPEGEAAIRAAAEQAGKSVSEWLAEAALEKASSETTEDEGLRAARELVAESEVRYGPIPEETWREADEFVASLGTAANGTMRQ